MAAVNCRVLYFLPYSVTVSFYVMPKLRITPKARALEFKNNGLYAFDSKTKCVPTVNVHDIVGEQERCMYQECTN